MVATPRAGVSGAAKQSWRQRSSQTIRHGEEDLGPSYRKVKHASKEEAGCKEEGCCKEEVSSQESCSHWEVEQQSCFLGILHHVIGQ